MNLNLDGLELSTKLLIQEAFSRGLEVEILDQGQNVIRIKSTEKSEIIQQATITSLDSAVVFQILGNKWVAKQLLNEAQIATAKAEHHLTIESANMAWTNWKDKAHVIKPTTTNYGIGIHIHPKPCSQKEYQTAIKDAFTKDDSILIESFLKGEEYRFLVVDDKCIAVLNRVPANVIGDGKQSIQELVNEKNSDPRRGKGYVTALEKIELGETELAHLNKQELSPSSIPEEHQQIFLRSNSNISTGGDSIDFTDEMHNSYKEIAIDATKASGAKICGVDLIIENPSSQANANNHGIVEVNYNPVLYFHDLPYKGKNRHSSKAVLDALNF